MRITPKLLGGLAVGATLIVALPAFAQTTTTGTSGSSTTGTVGATTTSVGTPNTGAGGDVATNLAVLTGSALALVAGGIYLARTRKVA